MKIKDKLYKKGTTVIISHHYHDKKYINKKGIITNVYHDNCILSQTTWICVNIDGNMCIIPKAFVLLAE